MRFEAVGLRAQMESGGAVKTVAVQQRHRWELLLGTGVDQCFRNGCSLQEAERAPSVQFDKLHQSYKPSTNQASCRRSRKIRNSPTPFRSCVAMSHSSRRHSSLFHQLPDILHGPLAQTISDDTSAKEIWMGLPVWQRTFAGSGGRNILMVMDGLPESSLCFTRLLSSDVKAIIRKSSGLCE